jgi:hypothetical protein
MPEADVIGGAVQTDAGGMPVAKAESPFELSKYVNADGSFTENLVKEVVPEDMRHLQVWKKFGDFKGLVRQTGELEKMIGKKGIVIPDPKTATPSDIDAYHRALGRPDKVEGYKLALPEDIQYTPESIKALQGFAFSHGWDNKSVQELLDFKAEMDRTDSAARQHAEEQEYKEAETSLREKWGTAYDVRLHMANYMIEKNVEVPAAKEALLGKIGNDPHVADFLATIAKKFIESGSVTDIDQMTGAMTPGEADAKMKELISEHQAHAKWRWDNPAGYKREEDEIDRLAKIAAS